MPNWASCSMQITNLIPEQVQRLQTAAEGGRLLAEILPEPDYATTPVAKTYPQLAASFAKTEEERATALENKPTIREDSWWDWRVQNWGVKWDPSDIHIDSEERSIILCFDSAWSPPNENWVQALIDQMPNAEVDLRYQEAGCDFYGVTLGTREGVTDIARDMSTMKEQWVEETQSPEIQAILADEDHPKFYETEEQVNEAWWEAQDDVICAAQDRLYEEMS